MFASTAKRCVPHRLRLKELADVDRHREILRELESLGHVVEYQPVACRVLLVHLHDIGGHVPVIRAGEGLDRLHRRQRLKAELAHEPVVVRPVCSERKAPVPHIPVVSVTLVLSIRIIERRAGRRRRWPERGIRILSSAHLGQELIEDLQILLPHGLVVLSAPVACEEPFHLIVAAPECEAWVMPDTPDVIDGLE